MKNTKFFIKTHERKYPIHIGKFESEVVDIPELESVRGLHPQNHVKLVRNRFQISFSIPSFAMINF